MKVHEGDVPIIEKLSAFEAAFDKIIVRNIVLGVAVLANQFLNV